MKNPKRFWRSLLFLILVAALCGGLALPMLAPVHAAPQLQAATTIVISEFRTRGSGGGNDEFIELYNPTGSAIPIGGWTIEKSSGCGGTTTILETIPPGVLLSSGQHYLSAASLYSGVTTPDYRNAGNWLIADNGGVAVLDNNVPPNIIDQAGMCATTTYREGTFLNPLAGTTDQSYERKPGGISDSCPDTGDNFSDFTNISPSAPQNSSSPLSLCGVILPTSTPTSTPSNTPTVTNTATATATNSPTNTSTPTATPTITNTSPPAATGIVISEFRTRGTVADDEFVELYNPTGVTIDISAWTIQKSSGCGGVTTILETIPAGVLLNSGQHYLSVGLSYAGTTPPDYRDAGNWSIADNGGIAVLDNSAVVIDQVGMCNATAYLEGTFLPPLTTIANRSYDRKSTPLGSCVDSNNNAADFILRTPSDAQNLSSPLAVCGNPTLTPTPSRTPTITRTPTRTRTPLPKPTQTRPPVLAPQPLVAINEFVPRPGHDWNNDGFVNVEDEYVEIINHGTISVNLSGYSLDDEVNIGSDPYRLPAITLKPGERVVFYGGDGVRFYQSNGQVKDAYNYSVVRYPDQSYCRLPDNGGLDDWNTNCYPTPGLPNALRGNFVNPPDNVEAEMLCPIADTLPLDFILAECPPFGNNIWRPSYWDNPGWYGENFLPESPGKWPVFVD